MTIMRTFSIILIILPLLFSACSDNSLGMGEENIIVSYEMVRVDDRTIPFLMDTTLFVPPEKADSCQTYYQGGWLTLDGNKEYEMEFDIRATLCEGTEDKSTSRRFNYGSFKYNVNKNGDNGSIHLHPDDELPFEKDEFKGEIRNIGINTNIWITIRNKLYVFERMQVSRD